MEGQNPGEPGSSGNVTSGEGQPVIASPPPTPPAYQQAIYSPPPVYAPPPQAYAPYPVMPPPAKPRSTGKALLIIGLVAVLLLVAGGVGAVLVNASLTSTYSAEKTVTDYLAAQKRGDANFMLANANYLRGDGSYGQYFEAGGLTSMLAIAKNTDISDVKIASTTVVDSNTSTVNVTMTWAGHHVVRAYTVHRDLTRTHFDFYNSWLIDIPFASINLTLPNQPGRITVDGLALPQGAVKDIHVIQGVHTVAMDGTDLYDADSKDADAIDSSASLVFAGTISANATASIKAEIKKAFTFCDKATNARQVCLNRTYYAPNQANTIYFFSNLPGYGEVDYTRYVWTLSGDPTKSMKLVVNADAGKLSASGPCGFTLTVNGSRKYVFKGNWTATLTFSYGTFTYTGGGGSCWKSKA